MIVSELQRQIINNYQGGLPLVEAPYRAMAEKLGCNEAEVLGNLAMMLSNGVLSRFGPLYDAVQLGGGLTLAALSVPEQRYDEVADIVNSFAEVAHNYRREHELNMWFVIATETQMEITSTLQAIAEATGLTIYDFPKQHEFYIGLWLQLDESGRVSTIPLPHTEKSSGTNRPLDATDRAIIRHTQAGLDLRPDPWQSIASAVGSKAEEVLQRLSRMQENGVIRRIGVVPNHYRLGLVANGMTVWDVDDADSHRLGELVGDLDFVSHCYLRPRHLPVWRYNLFAMVHGHDRTEVQTRAEQIADLLGEHCRNHEILFSTSILKKTGMRLVA